jgi:hypothetical protein
VILKVNWWWKNFNRNPLKLVVCCLLNIASSLTSIICTRLIMSSCTCLMFVALHPSISSSFGGCLSLQSDTFAWIPNDVPYYLCSGISSIVSKTISSIFEQVMWISTNTGIPKSKLLFTFSFK